MKAENLSLALNYIDYEFLNEVNQVAQKHQVKIKKFTVTAAVAACLAIIIALTSIFAGLKNNTPKTQKLQKIDITFDFGGGGMGGESAYNISEITNNNPWNEDMKIETMPLYLNYTDTDDKENIRTYSDVKKMRDKIYEIANRLGIKKENVEISDNYLSETQIEDAINKYALMGKDLPEDFYIPNRLIGKYENIEIEVDSSHYSITFKPSQKLPDNYKFNYYTNLEDAKKTGEYLLNKYKHLLDMKNPTLDIKGGDYNVYIQQSHRINVFDNFGSIQEKIFNYSLKNVNFSSDEQNGLSGIYMYYTNEPKKVGDYPIISVQKARELLLDGKYFTDSIPENVSEDKIKRVELIYRNAPWEKYNIPYYRFYVELSERSPFEIENGLNSYGSYYVPAIEDKYFANVPEWSMDFK